jgi:hypothetical protein
MKDVLLFITGFSLGITSFFFIVTNLNETSDIINAISIIVNIGIAVFVAFFIQNKITNSRYVKEYYISQLEATRIDYDLLLKNIRDNKLNRNEILKEFKYFSMKFTELDYSLTTQLKLKNALLQSKNRSIHVLITNSPEFNSTITNSKVKLNNSTLNQLLDNQKVINRLITSIVFSVNSK